VVSHLAAEQAIHQRIAQRIKLMRLFKEGAIAIVASYLYHANKDAIEPNSSICDMHDVETGIYTLTGAEAEHLHNFLEEQEPPFTPSYVELAYENFEQSYAVDDPKLKYLLLMIAAEVLFNDGAQELRYRISRGIAVLLSQTANEGREIFRTMRQLYDKRSLLVHTGAASDLGMEDVRLLRGLVRRAIVRLSVLRLSKAQLSELLTTAGFGTLDLPIKMAT
jgi:Apea-like HEPN